MVGADEAGVARAGEVADVPREVGPVVDMRHGGESGGIIVGDLFMVARQLGTGPANVAGGWQ